MTVKGTLIATLAAGYLATVAPVVAHAGDKAEAPKAEGEKASCKGPNGCKGGDHKKAKGKEKAEKKEGGEKAEKPAEEKK